MAVLVCPTCKARLHLPPAGAKVACPKCGQRIRVPDPPPPKPAAGNPTVLGAWQDELPPVRTPPAGGDPPPAGEESAEGPAAPAPEPKPVAVPITPTPPASPAADDEPPAPSRRRPSSREKFCHECGEVIKARAEICPRCGVRQPGGGRRAPEPFDGEPHRGIPILVMGVLSLFIMPLPLGLVAWLWANEDLKKMGAGTMDPEGQGMTQAGKVCGMISVILSAAALTFTLLYFLCLFAACGVFTAAPLARPSHEPKPNPQPNPNVPNKPTHRAELPAPRPAVAWTKDAGARAARPAPPFALPTL